MNNGNRVNSIGDETVEAEGVVEASTAKALLVDFTMGPKEWVPKSQIVEQHKIDGELYVFQLTKWFAKKIKIC